MSYVLVSHENMEIHKAIFEDALPKASKRVCIASSTLKDFRLSDPHRPSIRLFSNYINRLCNAWVRVQILTTPKMLNFRFAKKLHSRVEVRACARNHLKMICVDNSILYVGTGNMTSSAVGLRSPRRRNFEMGILMTNIASVRFALGIFDKIWSGHYCLNCKYSSRRDIGCTIPSESRNVL